MHQRDTVERSSNGACTIATVIGMIRKFDAEEVLEILVGVLAGGVGPPRTYENPILGIPSFRGALEEDRARSRRSPGSSGQGNQPSRRFPIPKNKRKASAYSKRYGKEFKRLAPKYKKKNGAWKKDGFKRCAAAARRKAKK